MCKKRLNENDFRIVEYHNKFRIQRQLKCGLIFKTSKWVDVDKYGEPVISHLYYHEDPKTYKTLKKARKKLSKILEGSNYYTLKSDDKCKSSKCSTSNKKSNIHSLNDEN